jgi:hypothetical protein
MTDQIVKTMQRVSPLRHEAEVVAFEATLRALPPSPDPELLAALHLVFDDATANPEVMFELVHYLESCPAGLRLRAMLSVLPAMVAKAPWWCKVLHYRILSDPASRAEYASVVATAAPEARAVACRILTTIASEERVGISDEAGRMVQELCGEE